MFPTNYITEQVPQILPCLYCYVSESKHIFVVFYKVNKDVTSKYNYPVFYLGAEFTLMSLNKISVKTIDRIIKFTVCSNIVKEIKEC